MTKNRGLAIFCVILVSVLIVTTYARDVEDLRRMYGEVKSKVSERLVKMIRE